jgi:hypothetical protein
MVQHSHAAYIEAAVPSLPFSARHCLHFNHDFSSKFDETPRCHYCKLHTVLYFITEDKGNVYLYEPTRFVSRQCEQQQLMSLSKK